MAFRIEESMTFSFDFISPIEVDIEETKIGVALIKGILLSEGVSKNGNLYTIEEMEKIAERAIGVPVYYGVMEKYDPERGWIRNAHANVETNRVGRILHAWFDPVVRKIRFIAEIVNTSKFPNLIEQIKKGWGVSIGGRGFAEYIKDKAGRILAKIKNLIVGHVQIIPPEVPRGQDEAKIEDVQVIQETMIFYELPKPAINAEINIGVGIKSVNIELKGWE